LRHKVGEIEPWTQIAKKYKIDFFCHFQPSLMKLSPLVEGEETGSKEEIRTPKRDDPDKKWKRIRNNVP
jgi:hypothetical protein